MGARRVTAGDPAAGGRDQCSPTSGLVAAPAIPDLPDRFLMPDGLLERTGPGWILLPTPRRIPTQPDHDLYAVLLVSPDGVVYQAALLHYADLLPTGAAAVRLTSPS